MKNKRMFQVLIGGLIIVIALLLLSGCGNKTVSDGNDIFIEGSYGAGDNAKTNTSGLISFSFDEGGTIAGIWNHWEVRMEDSGKIIFEYRNNENETMSCEADQSLIDSLNSIYMERHLARWDGFDRYAPHVYDGVYFYIDFGFADGEIMHAHGYMAYPEDYEETIDEIKEVMKPYVDTFLEEVRHETVSDDKDRFIEGSYGAGDKAKTNTSGLVLFSFYEDIAGIYSHWEVRMEDSGKIIFEYRNNENETMSCEADQSLIDSLNSIYMERHLARWDGFDRKDPSICNGWVFCIDFGFTDGGIMHAEGCMAYPEEYEESIDEIKEAMKPYVDTLLEEVRHETVSDDKDRFIEGSYGAGDKAKTNASGLASFSFDEGGIAGIWNHWEVYMEDSGKIIFEYRNNENETMSCEADQSLIDSLNSIYMERHLARWDGFDRKALSIHDGWEFCIDLRFADGEIMHAEGYMAYPEEYEETIDEIKEVMKPYVDTFLE